MGSKWLCSCCFAMCFFFPDLSKTWCSFFVEWEASFFSMSFDLCSGDCFDKTVVLFNSDINQRENKNKPFHFLKIRRNTWNTCWRKINNLISNNIEDLLILKYSLFAYWTNKIYITVSTHVMQNFSFGIQQRKM